MKPAEPAVSGRTPYAERPDIIARYCEGCRYPVLERDDPGHEGEEYTEWVRIYTDPHCPLHGDDRKEAPF